MIKNKNTHLSKFPFLFMLGFSLLQWVFKEVRVDARTGIDAVLLLLPLQRVI